MIGLDFYFHTLLLKDLKLSRLILFISDKEATNMNYKVSGAPIIDTSVH